MHYVQELRELHFIPTSLFAPTCLPVGQYLLLSTVNVALYLHDMNAGNIRQNK